MKTKRAIVTLLTLSVVAGAVAGVARTAPRDEHPCGATLTISCRTVDGHTCDGDYMREYARKLGLVFKRHLYIKGNYIYLEVEDDVNCK